MIIKFKNTTGICLLLLLHIFFFTGCRQKKVIDNFNSDAFRKDKLGCLGTRQQMQPDFERIRLQLKGLSENELLDLLGKPDFQQLSTRNQKYYIYFLEKGRQCENKFAATPSKTAVFRFSAIGLVTEITYEAGKPE